MSLIKSFSDANNDPGVKFELCKDPDNVDRVVSLQIRATPETKKREIMAGYGAEEKVQLNVGDKSAYVKQRVFGVEEMAGVAIEQAAFAWIGSENLFITPKDQEEVTFLARIFQTDDVQIDKEICVDKKLTQAMKLHILNAMPELIDWINTKSNSLSVRNFRKEERLTKNL